MIIVAANRQQYNRHHRHRHRRSRLCHRHRVRAIQTKNYLKKKVILSLKIISTTIHRKQIQIHKRTRTNTCSMWLCVYIWTIHMMWYVYYTIYNNQKRKEKMKELKPRTAHQCRCCRERRKNFSHEKTDYFLWNFFFIT